MSRRLTQRFEYDILEKLVGQVLYLPERKREEQVIHAEALHDLIEDGRVYPYDFLHHSITQFHSESNEPMLLEGSRVKPDLRLFVDRVSKTLVMSDAGIVNSNVLATSLNVSTRTIGRWREKGLRWRWVKGSDDGLMRIGFTEGAVKQFLEGNKERVARAGTFEHIGDDVKAEIVRRGRRLSLATGAVRDLIYTHLSKRIGPTKESVRQIILKHDEGLEIGRVFEPKRGALKSREKKVILRAWRMGVSRRLIGDKYGLPRTTLGRVVCQEKAKVFRKLKNSWIDNPTFDLADAYAAFKGNDEELIIERAIGRSGGLVLPENLGRYYEVKTADEDLFTGQFLRYNFMKRRARVLIEGLDRVDPKLGEVRLIEEAIGLYTTARKVIGRLSLPLVHDVVMRQISGDGHVGNQMTPFYLLGGMAFEVLSSAIEGFDVRKDVAFGSLLGVRLNQRFARYHDSDNKRALKRFDEERGYLYLRSVAQGFGFDCLD